MTQLAVLGFRAAGVRCGIKRRGLDLMLIESATPAAAAGVFTRSTVVGAPVVVSRQRVRRGRARAIVANSGCSNVAMGARGLADARAMTAAVARALGCTPADVLVASTGVIGQPLPLERIEQGIPRAVRALRRDGLRDAARAIMTTDTVPKHAALRLRIDGRTVTLAGIAKGAGMIEPNVATMLSFLLTDAAVAPALLRRLLRQAADASFNRVTIDGEGSTSDTVLLLANGRAGNRLLSDAASAGARRLAGALGELCGELARAIARDGEGATRLVTVRVEGARSAAEAERAARRIANSLLVKTALFGGDPNWGRILQTIGAGRVAIRLPRAEVRLGGVPVFRAGASTGPAARARAGRALRGREVEVAVALGAGRHAASLWTCDLSYDYVRINAEYTT
ncbi:MAG TPA: bifunctional glutamate N-acetyltransferase/amino-acid acetyltransferase ArgJ [Myxococcota bacterium]